mmetsp:Transcript_4820/g.15562  ORF Transcript_4820/g.15562 Transcript_4820/m.15562 type:complete len:494 (+) Transcript_4820:676-2157(+)
MPEQACERVALSQTRGHPLHGRLKQVASLLPPRQLAAPPRARHETNLLRKAPPQQLASEGEARPGSSLVRLVGVQRVSRDAPPLFFPGLLREGADAHVGRRRGGALLEQRSPARHVGLTAERKDQSARALRRKAGACPAEDEHVHVVELVERVELRGAVGEARRPARRGKERVEPAAVAADGEPGLRVRSGEGSESAGEVLDGAAVVEEVSADDQVSGSCEVGWQRRGPVEAARLQSLRRLPRRRDGVAVGADVGGEERDVLGQVGERDVCTQRGGGEADEAAPRPELDHYLACEAGASPRRPALDGFGEDHGAVPHRRGEPQRAKGPLLQPQADEPRARRELVRIVALEPVRVALVLSRPSEPLERRGLHGWAAGSALRGSRAAGWPPGGWPLAPAAAVASLPVGRKQAVKALTENHRLGTIEQPVLDNNHYCLKHVGHAAQMRRERKLRDERRNQCGAAGRRKARGLDGGANLLLVERCVVERRVALAALH